MTGFAKLRSCNPFERLWSSSWLRIFPQERIIMITWPYTHLRERKDMKHAEKKPPRPGLHKDFRVWVALGLMLAAMGIYVLTLDDSIQPGSAAGNGAPAAADTTRPQR